jgi:hypothetical protein
MKSKTGSYSYTVTNNTASTETMVANKPLGFLKEAEVESFDIGEKIPLKTFNFH